MSDKANPFREFARDIKLEHSLFALPFAFIGVLGPIYRGTAIITFPKLLLVLLALFFARTAAMGFNRYFDAGFDRLNPRTADRAIPAGRLVAGTVLAYVGIASVCFVVSAFAINALAGWLSPLALLVILGYSTAKRWTNWSHLILGLALALAPAGGWIAFSGKLEPQLLPLVVGVLFWVAGFDVLYALQDMAFDRSKGLHSIPARFGRNAAFGIAAAFHVIVLLAFWIFGAWIALGMGWRIACLVTGILLATEHLLAREPDRIPVAFFNVNAVIGFVLLAGFLFDGFQRGIF